MLFRLKISGYSPVDNDRLNIIYKGWQSRSAHLGIKVADILSEPVDVFCFILLEESHSTNFLGSKFKIKWGLFFLDHFGVNKQTFLKILKNFEKCEGAGQNTEFLRARSIESYSRNEKNLKRVID